MAFFVWCFVCFSEGGQECPPSVGGGQDGYAPFFIAHEAQGDAKCVLKKARMPAHWECGWRESAEGKKMRFSEIYEAGEWRGRAAVRQVEELIRPCSSAALEAMAARARGLTLQQFGRTVRMFAPVYLSNECVNVCTYCGFSRDNPILRSTLSVEEVQAESRHLADEGFRSILLVAGEHPKFVSEGYMADCVRAIHPWTPSISIEVAPMEIEPYRQIVEAGAEGLVVYQETYNQEAYVPLHRAGPKKDFLWRLDTPERGYEAGFKRLGIGALLGLDDWRQEIIVLAGHADHLLRHCWKSFLTLSLPRLRPAAGGFHPPHPVSDRDLVQMLCALRIAFPQVGLVLSTREPAPLRDRLIPIGITHLSAGSHTEPGGYTGKGKDRLHQTVRGRQMPIEEADGQALATGQFHIADERSAGVMAHALRGMGYDPVWKDWDRGLSPHPSL